MNTKTLQKSLLLLLCATIWGIAFVAQSVGMEYVGPYTFSAVRNVIGTIVLLPFIFVINHNNKKKSIVISNEEKKTLWIGGIICGFFLFVATNLQQYGILYTTVGKAGFITAMYIVLVPIVGIFLHKKVGKKLWAGVAIAVIGLYLLCMSSGDFTLQIGDLFLLGCALTFSFQILAVDHFAPKVHSGIKLAAIQFSSCAVFSGICMFIFETPSISSIISAWLPICYAGALSSGVAYTLQIVGQKDMNPTLASLIMSMESMISLLAGWLILHQTLTNRELLGCMVMFVAIILVQIPDKHKRDC